MPVKVIGIWVVILLTSLVGVRFFANVEPVIKVDKRQAALGLSPGGWILDLEDTELRADLDAAIELGITTLRLDLDWSRIERSQGNFNWGPTDTIISEADQRGIQVLALLTYTPDWARPGEGSDKSPPNDDAAFAEFARLAAERYSDAGVFAWEVWNEPNVAGFWDAPDGPDPERYASLFQATADAVRTVDPDAFVLSGGLAPAKDRRGKEMSPETFLDLMFHNLEPGSVSAVAIHPYSFPTTPSDRSKDWNLFARLPSIRDLVADAEGKPVPIWLTEFGAPTGEAQNSISEERQAEIVREALLCVNQFNWAGPLFLYNLRDRPGGEPDQSEDNFGLLRENRQLKPSGTAVQEFQQIPTGDPVNSPCRDW